MRLSKRHLALTLAGLSLGSFAVSRPYQNVENGLIAVTQISVGANLVTGSVRVKHVPDQPISQTVPWASDASRAVEDIAALRQSVPTEDVTPPQRKPSVQQLAVGLLRELKRVGCYGDEIGSEWTETAKRAMRAFNAKVNAKLPVDVPDHVLLTLVSGHKGRACEKPCSTVGRNENCLPLKEQASIEAGPLHRTSFRVASVGNELLPLVRGATPAMPIESEAIAPPSAAPGPSKASPEAKAAAAVVKGSALAKVSSSTGARQANYSKASKAAGSPARPRVVSAATTGFDGNKYFRDMTHRGS